MVSKALDKPTVYSLFLIAEEILSYKQAKA